MTTFHYYKPHWLYKVIIKIDRLRQRSADSAILGPYRDWLSKENIMYVSYIADANYDAYVFAFHDANDAMRFRLVWG